jgi:hypothetical protein
MQYDSNTSWLNGPLDNTRQLSMGGPGLQAINCDSRKLANVER